MRKNILIVCLITFLSNCSKSYIQVFETKTTNIQTKDNAFIFENDTIKITYSFWANKGVMSFTVYNKLEKPIYIDWKNSSFILKDNKLNYWVDESNTNSSSYYGGYFYNGSNLKNGMVLNGGIQNSFSSTFKPEKITFIPPKSNYNRSQFFLLPIEYYRLSLNCQKSVVPRNDDFKKKTRVYSEDFTLENSPLKFRNFLAFTFSENSQDFTFVDNEFYLTSVKEMDLRHYKGSEIYDDKSGKMSYELPYKKQNNFFISIKAEKSIEYRKEYANK